MNEPDPGTVRVATEKLRADAQMWSDTAIGTQAMAGAARGLTLTVQELSFAAEETGLLGTYQGLQQRMATLCDQAFGAINSIAGYLTNAADFYDELEQRNAVGISTAGFGQPEPPR